jgi:tRNA-specific 2-thiouridylase
VEATLQEDGKLLLRSLEPQRAVTPGQSAVLYLGENCIGGAVVEQILDAGKANIPGV